MNMHSKLIHRSAAAVLVIATVASIGTAVGVYAGDDERSPAPPARVENAVQSTASTTGPAGPACDMLPDSWVVRDPATFGGSGDAVNPWAAGDAAAARYFNELSRLCAGS